VTTKGKSDAGTAGKIGAAGGLIAVVATGFQFGLPAGIALFGTFLFFMSLAVGMLSRLTENVTAGQQRAPEGR
jgi:hypothetical protein